MKNYKLSFLLAIFLASCSPFKLSRSGYQNLRQQSDTTCNVQIYEPGYQNSPENKLGQLTVKAKPFHRNTNKEFALKLIKEEACAVNANEVYIIEEKNKNPDKSYSCTVYLCRTVKKQNTIPDFVNRAKSEIEVAKRQRKELEKGRDFDKDTLPEDQIIEEIDISNIGLTELKEYEKKDSIISQPETEEIIDIKPTVATNAGKQQTNLHIDSLPEKTKLEKGFFASVGYGYGGTSYAGLELEYAVDRFGLFAGSGVFGYTYGLNIHLKRDPISSYISILYQNVGLTEFYRYSLAGMAANYRGKRWLTARIGVGKILNLAEEEPHKNYAPILSIGAYIPF